MDIKKLNPWNWFNKEEEETQGRNVALERQGSNQAVQSAEMTTPQLYSPFAGIAQLHQQIDRMFDNVFRGFGFPSLASSSWGFDSPLLSSASSALIRPRVDIAANDKQYTVTVEVPGVEENDVKLELSPDGVLTIRGQKKQEKEDKDTNFYRLERSYGSFQRVLSLPQDVDQDQISAAFKQGVLTITLPRKAGAQAESRNIEINKAA